MRRVPALPVLLAAAAAIAAACSSSGSKPAHIDGLVVDPSGVGVAGAAVAIGGAGTTAAADGSFALDVTSGTRHVSASASGFYPTGADVPIAAGVNHIDLTLLPCAPGDTTCAGATPTPTPSATPTAPPGANLIASFDGLNYPGSGQPPASTASATNTTTGTVWGDSTGSNYSWTECYKDANEQFPLGPADTFASIDHCFVDWVKPGGATNTGMGYVDAFVELRVDGATWAIAAPDQTTPKTIRCSVALGTCTLDYYEVIPNVQMTKFDTASAGVADIVVGGYKSPQPVTVQNGAFLAPTFP